MFDTATFTNVINHLNKTILYKLFLFTVNYCKITLHLLYTTQPLINIEFIMLLGVKFTVNSKFKIKFYLFFYFSTVKCKVYTKVYT
jgi:hypothetical protein